MKHIYLTTLLALLTATAQADISNEVSSESSPTSAAVSAEPAAPAAEPSSAPESASVIPSPQPIKPVINCQYHIPSDTTNIDQNTIQTWVEHAIIQSFDFNPSTMDEQLAALKSCFTDQGWQGFTDALQKSGNIDAIKSQQLTVSSEVSNPLSITPMKDNQWKVVIPIQVVYQNDKEKLSQALIVNLLLGRKPNGDLGIMQMIATPQESTTPAVSATTTPNPSDMPKDPMVEAPTNNTESTQQ